MTREDIDNVQAVLLGAARWKDMTENDLFLPIVSGGIELKLGVFVRVIDRPAGKRPRDCNDVLLRVTSIHAQRVQFHQLARVVLV